MYTRTSKEKFKPTIEETALYLGSLTEGLNDGFTVIIIPLLVMKYIVSSVHFPEPVISGFLIASGAIVDAVLLPIFGKISDRSQKYKQILSVGRGLLLLSLFGFMFCEGFWLALFLRILQGVATAMILPSSLTLIAENAEISHRTISQGYQSTFRVLGGVVGPLLAGLADTFIAFKMEFVWMALIWLAISLLIEWCVPTEVQRKGASKEKEIEAAGFWDYLDWKDLIALGSVMAMTAYVIYMISALQTQLNLKLGGTTFIFSVAYSLPAATRILLQIPVGNLIMRYKLKPFLLSGMALLMMAVFGMNYTMNISELIIFRFLQGIGASLTMVSALGIISVASNPVQIGRNIGISTASFSAGMSMGPFISGLLASYFSARNSFFFPIILCGFSIILVSVLLKSYDLRKE